MYIFIIFNAYPNKKLINYSLSVQLIDILPSMTLGIIMSLSVYLFGFLRIPTLPLMLIQIIVGISVYLGLSVLTKNRELNYLLGLVKRL